MNVWYVDTESIYVYAKWDTIIEVILLINNYTYMQIDGEMLK